MPPASGIGPTSPDAECRQRGACRDCFGRVVGEARCTACGSRRVLRHPEFATLSVAHVDCDAFFASVEKRDRPELRSRPVIVGGGTRGVVAACCYVARTRGVRSAMPMFRALAACPDAVVLRPDMAKYAVASRAVRALMDRLTPLVQVLSVDEAVLDLRGTEALHGCPPAVALMRFAAAVEREVGVSVSIGLAPNRLLAKIAAGLDKPRGFAVVSIEDAPALLAERPVGALPGIGPVQARRLEMSGFRTLGQIAALSPTEAARRLGDDGPRLAARARGEDDRSIQPERDTKSVSAETTFDADLSGLVELEPPLWRLCEKLSRRLGEKSLAAGGVVLKLKTGRHALRSRHVRLPGPTMVPETLFAAAHALLAREVDGTAFRLIGIGAQPVVEAAGADQGDLADADAPRRAARWQAMEALRQRFGDAAPRVGRGLRG